MAMNKILYVLPALAILGLIPVVDADAIQQRIEILQGQIAELQERIDQNPDSKKIAKWEAKIDRLQERVAELEARQAKAAQTITPPQEPASARQEGDTTPPSLVSATMDPLTQVVTVVFDETVDVSDSDWGALYLRHDNTNYHGFSIATAVDSDTVTGSFRGTAVSDGDPALLNIGPRINGSIEDIHGNAQTEYSFVTVGFADVTPPSLVQATLDLNTGILTVVFDEPIDPSSVRPSFWVLANRDDATDRQFLGDSEFDGTAPASETVTVTLSRAALDWVGDKSLVILLSGKVSDTSGNAYSNPANGDPLTVIPLTPETPDTAGPLVLSATLDPAAGTLAVVFDEAIDLSEVHLEEIWLGEYTLAAASLDRTAGDSDTLILALSQASLGTIGALANPALDFNRGAVSDTDGNVLQAVTVPITVTNAPEETPTEDTPTETPTEEAATCSVSNGGNQDWRLTGPCGAMAPDNTPVIATVTIAAGSGFGVDSGTVELAKSDLMAFSVDFVNDGDRTYAVLADLISRNSWHAGADIRMPAGTTANAGTFIVDGYMQPGDTAYLVFGVADDPDTPEHEPDTIRGDQLVKIRITEPAG